MFFISFGPMARSFARGFALTKLHTHEEGMFEQVKILLEKQAKCSKDKASC